MGHQGKGRVNIGYKEKAFHWKKEIFTLLSKYLPTYRFYE